MERKMFFETKAAANYYRKVCHTAEYAKNLRVVPTTKTRLSDDDTEWEVSHGWTVIYTGKTR